jgi:hypothetical protein
VSILASGERSQKLANESPSTGTDLRRRACVDADS